ncbi:DoxX family protein [Mycobacteroides abscessus subsp. bolletii]|nr:DoxX family protein [Mycobacteroides abscessus subsp. bolletii]SKP68115.1 DoxX family protein [Mycobacteroides abscessus subsp. bolletii]SKP69117.1 DoxX family protein [Mycobacteroides abscessus subsp. bolletii]SKQ27756.1 DoxX family protein [Mycobacteroides abscessus subsp. bolletii]
MAVEKFDEQLRWPVPMGARVFLGCFSCWRALRSSSVGGLDRPPAPGIPFLNWPYWWAGVLEVIVGALLVLGLWTRTAAVLGSGAMAYAYFFTHVPTSWNPVENDGGYAVALCWGFLLLAVIAKDARYSLDRVIARRRLS